MSTQVETMNAQQVASRLVQLCREGKNVEAINELYDDNIVSIEPEGSPMAGKTVGKQAVLESTNRWFDSVEKLHSVAISNPLVTMKVDATYKQHGRNVMNELCVFEVRDGRIVSDQFFYRTGQ
jgi:ketosteroid isomerase-like protein